MKILITGGSSFTGYWFIKELSQAGHKVYATFTKKLDDYTGIRKLRVDELRNLCTPLEECEFGDTNFIDFIKQNRYDLFCHHMAMVSDFSYRAMDYNIPNALEESTKNIDLVMQALKDNGCRAVLVTGSIFEAGEGKGQGADKPAYPYALSKTFTYEVVKYYAEHYGLNHGKFVISNPFGPMEEPKFTSYLMQTWIKKEEAAVKTPEYIRDNIHVSLLAKIYKEFAEDVYKSKSPLKINPSGYVGKQGEFAERFRDEIKKRFDLECKLALLEQTEFSEPKELVNTDVPNTSKFNFIEAKAWDDLADFYRKVYF